MKSFEKVYLKKSSIALCSGLDERTETETLLVWYMNNFSKLKDDIFYVKSVSSVDSKWTFRAMKHKGSLFLAVHTNDIKKDVAFRFFMKNGTALATIPAEEIDAGLYIAEYPLSDIIQFKNQFTEDDTMRVQCKYVSWPVEGVCSVVPYGSYRTEVDRTTLCQEIKDLYTKSLFFDFLIRVENVVFKTHKLILATRSRYIAEMLKENGSYCTQNCISIDTDPSIMNEVLLYVYSGELKHLTVKCMILMLRVSSELKIDCLVEKCIKYLKENLTMNNIVDIHGVGLELDITELKNAAIHFLQKRNSNVLHTQEWKLIQKQYEELKKQK